MTINKALLIAAVVVFIFAAFGFTPFDVEMVALGLALGFGSMLA